MWIARRQDFEEELKETAALLETETDARTRKVLEGGAAQTRKVLAVIDRALGLYVVK